MPLPFSPPLLSFLSLLLLLTTTTTASALHISKRSLITPTDLRESYDYIIAGGGLAGLVLASRLSENSSLSVLVLEAGGSGDDARDRIDPPGGAYWTSLVGGSYDWAHNTAPQANLSGRTISWPRGKILGGSTAMNAMYLVRPSSVELDAWSEMLNGMGDDGSGIPASVYNWRNMYTYMRKAETFTPALDDAARVGNIQYDDRNYGTTGPMHVSYPAVQIDMTGSWISTLSTLGIPPLPNANGGSSLGGYITPSSINPTNWTRSYSRSAYIDPLPPRENLHILTNALVTRVVFSEQDGEHVASGVEFAESVEGERRVVRVGREVVLSAGPVGSPKILMLSGVGPRDVLESVGVEVMEELPGVGQHLQDHITAGVEYQANFETAGDIHASNSDFSRTPEFLSSINNAIAFLNLSTLFTHSPEALTAIQSQLSSQLDDRLVPSAYEEVREGYRAIYRVNSEVFARSAEVPQVEILLSLVGVGRVYLQAALQHPFSTGRVYIPSSNPFDEPIVDPQYFSHPADIILLRQALKLARTLGTAFQSQGLFGAETFPGGEVQSDEDWENWLRGNVGTQYHPTGSCAMMRREFGGVVGKDMRVHGVRGVRVVDSSVFGVEFAAHLASATYGLAELGAQLILNETGVVSAVENVDQNQNTGASGSTPAPTGTLTSSAGPSRLRVGIVAIAGYVVGALLSLVV